jgi:hypothetical protein
MENLVPVQEIIDKTVESSFHSVDLINKLKTQMSLSEDDQATMQRNIDHLNLLLSKEWYVEALTEEQRAEVDSAVNTLES